MADEDFEQQLLDAIREGAHVQRWHALTPFEQQIALALSDRLVRGDSIADCPVSAETLRLAPRIAAAIKAAGQVVLRSVEDGDRAQAAALAVLRGADA